MTRSERITVEAQRVAREHVDSLNNTIFTMPTPTREREQLMWAMGVIVSLLNETRTWDQIVSAVDTAETRMKQYPDDHAWTQAWTAIHEAASDMLATRQENK